MKDSFKSDGRFNALSRISDELLKDSFQFNGRFKRSSRISNVSSKDSWRFRDEFMIDPGFRVFVNVTVIDSGASWGILNISFGFHFIRRRLEILEAFLQV